MMKKILLAFLIGVFLPTKVMLAEEMANELPNFTGKLVVSGNEADSTVRTLRFLTTLNSPPFSFLDQEGRLNGFNVYLAKSICSELKIQSACTIQALPVDELKQALSDDRGDAIIAGLASTAEAREDLSFSYSYMRFPGRFMSLKESAKANNFDNGLSGISVGVVAGSGHEKLARSYFPDANVIGIASDELLISELKTGKLDMAFGDGLFLSFFVNGNASNNCCKLVGGAYYSSLILGEGMRVATLNTRPDLIQAIDGALTSLQAKRGIDELFLRFFPHNFF